eukprot:2743593-Rhodomonas_salina.2
MDRMHEKGVLTPVRKEKGMRVIPTRFVFKIKTNEVGKVIKYKARLVAQGFHQIRRVDFTESYAPVSSAAAVRAA